MKRIILLLMLLLVTTAGSALAASIGGHLGATFRGGIIFPADQKLSGGGTLETDSGYSYGGGIIYGLNNNVAAEVELYHSKFKADFNGTGAENFSANNISIGGHYRFIGTAPMMQKAVPYVGGGIDVIMADGKSINGISRNMNPAMGGHVKAGCDFFINSNLALNVELRGLLSNESNIRSGGVTIGKFDGSTLSTLFGARLFF